MATFVPLVHGGWVNLDHAVQLVPGEDGEYEVLLAGSQRGPLVIDQETLDGVLTPPEGETPEAPHVEPHAAEETETEPRPHHRRRKGS